MTKAQFIQNLRKLAPEIKSNDAAEKLLDAFGETLVTGLRDDGEVVLPPLGKLKIKTVAARKGRNPKTGEQLDLPERRKIAFTQSKAFKP